MTARSVLLAVCGVACAPEPAGPHACLGSSLAVSWDVALEVDAEALATALEADLPGADCVTGPTYVQCVDAEDACAWSHEDAVSRERSFRASVFDFDPALDAPEVPVVEDCACRGTGPR